MAATQPATSSDSSKALFRFRDLSGELRNRIYELLLVRDEPIDLDHERVAEPALWCVDRKTRFEAQGVFYGDNLFLTPDQFHLQSSIRVLGPERAAMLRRIRAVYFTSSLKYARQMLESLIQGAGGMVSDTAIWIWLSFRTSKPGDAHERNVTERVNLDKLEEFVQLEDDGPTYRKTNVQRELGIE